VILLERESQLGSLRQYADEARLGTGRFVLISGEAGVGKTSLLEELDRGLLDATRAWGGCDGLFTPRPLAPLRDIARELGGDLAETVRGVSREEVFDAVLRRLETIEGLAVLVVEDVHWADEATLDLLRFLARRLVRLPVLVLVTFRDDALAPGDPLRLALGELAGQRCTRRIDLPPLTTEAVRRLAEGTSYAPDELYELTAGNPFFVTEVVGSGGDQIPASARDAVLARAARLSTVARATLDLAALDSSRIDTELIARAGATGPEAFDELVASGLLKIDGRTLRFRHELARRAIESEVPPHRRLAGHRALHDVLTQQGCDDEARLAYHAEGAGEPELVRRHAPLAARRAAAMGAYREAAAQYERALRYPPDDPRALAELLDEYADQLALVDSWTRAADSFERAAALWHDLGDARREGYAYAHLGTVYWRLCRGPEAVEATHRALALLEPMGPDPELARTLALHALEAWRGDPTVGQELMDRAVAMAEHLDDPSARSRVLNNSAWAAYLRGDDWRPVMAESLRIAVEAGAEAATGHAYTNSYAMYAGDFRFAEGERFWREGLAFCDQRDLATFGSCLRGHRALALLDLGRWDEVLTVTEQVFGMEVSPINLVTSQVARALTLARRGLPGAVDLLDRAIESVEGIAEGEWIALARLAQAERLWLDGEDDAALREVDRVRDVIAPSMPDEDAQTAVWERRLLGAPRNALTPREPWATWLTGTPDAAAARWGALGCPYHAALALCDSGDEEHLREAIGRFESLGAEAASRRVRQRMKDLGYRSVPTGARPSTREHPWGLTRRENEVLLLLCEGLTNDEIVVKLVVSSRTVDHHVSAVLAKLGVSSRGAAAAAARRGGLASATT
jgi:DNA-binding CsgD family transcriptional regulator/tetratricopeptide (TPR) repeat protein